MTETIEITTFHLAGRSTFADFVAANADVDAWLLRQPGFKSRRIARGSDGEVVDMLLWRSEADARRAVQGLMTELRDSPVHGLIDHATVRWTLSTVGHTLGAVD